MTAVIPFSYMNTVGAIGAFTISTNGGVQGTQYDDPETRWSLRSGLVADSEVLPMWGGVGIYENIPSTASGQPLESLGCVIGRATTLVGTSAKGLSGFSLFNQVYNAPISTFSSVPMSASGMTFNYQRLGSGARIWVAADPSLISLEGGVVGQQVSWDFNNQVLQPYDASTATIAASSTVTWAATNGGQLTFPVANWTGAFQPGAGDVLTISGATNSGTGGAAAVNQAFVVVSSTTTEAVFAAPAATGVFGTIGGSPVLNFGTGALNVRVDALIPAGNMVVQYHPSNGTASWNYNGCCAVITI